MSQESYQEVKALVQKGLSVKGACEAIGVARASYYRYLRRHKEKRDPRKRGRPCVVSSLTGKVLEVSRRYPTEGYRLIWARLIRSEYQVSQSSVYRILKEHNLLLPREGTGVFRGLRKVGQRPPEPGCPNHRWQMDVKELRIGSHKAFLLNIIDCYSRYVLASHITFNPTCGEALEALRMALAQAYKHHESLPEEVELVSDNGPCFRAGRFKLEARGFGFNHIYISIAHPQSNGRIERWHRTLKYDELLRHDYEDILEADMSIKAFLTYYNEDRPHSAIGYRTPLEAYTNRSGPEGLNFIRAKSVSNG